MNLYDAILDDLYDEQGFGPKTLAAWHKIPVAEARHLLQMMVANGDAEFGYLVRDEFDRKMAGRGYWRTDQGRRKCDEANQAALRDSRSGALSQASQGLGA